MANIPNKVRPNTTLKYAMGVITVMWLRQLKKYWRSKARMVGSLGQPILFLIALRMVFPHAEGIFGDTGDTGTFIVPLAIPAIAGPSALATVLLLVSREPQRVYAWVAALSLAMLVTALVMISAQRISGWIGKRGVIAIERLMGLVLTAIAVEMLLAGAASFVAQLPR